MKRHVGIAALGLLLAAVGCGSKSSGQSSSVCPVGDELLSDFKMDNGILPVDGRTGGWYTYGDKEGSGMLVPAEGGGAPPDLDTGNPNCSGPGSLHVISTGFRDWGSAMAVDFKGKLFTDAGLVGKGTYDASAYKGIAFWARSAAPIPFVQVAVLDTYTIPESV